MRGKKLFVGVENSIWIQQMTFQKKTIIKKINDFLGDEYIEELIFKISRKPTEELFFNEESRLVIEGELKTDNEESLDLDSITLSPEDHAKIQVEIKKLGALSEEIKTHTKNLLEKSYKRKKYFKLHGYKECKCGVQYNSLDSMCAICINKETLKLEEFLMGAFKQKKLLKYNEETKELSSFTEKEYDRIKLKKLSKIKKDIDIYLKNRKDHLAFELAKLYMVIELGDLTNDYIEKRAEEFLQVLKKI